jgi:hypothetical protein
VKSFGAILEGEIMCKLGAVEGLPAENGAADKKQKNSFQLNCHRVFQQ